MKEKYTKENLLNIISNSSSLSEVIKKLGLKVTGGNYETVKKYCIKYNIDISNLTGLLWNKGILYIEKTAVIPLEEIVQNNVKYKSSSLKLRLIAASLKKDQCELCGCLNLWMGKPITLELHHIDGNHYNNSIDNLQILCPNCHSQTDSYRKRKKYSKIPSPISKLKNIDRICTCLYCNKEFITDRLDKKRRFCSIECYHLYIKEFSVLTFLKQESLIIKELLLELVLNYNTIQAIAELLNCNRCTVRSYLKKYDLYDIFKSKQIKQ